MVQLIHIQYMIKYFRQSFEWFYKIFSLCINCHEYYIVINMLFNHLILIKNKFFSQFYFFGKLTNLYWINSIFENLNIELVEVQMYT